MIIKVKLPVWLKNQGIALHGQQRNAKVGNHVHELLKMGKEKKNSFKSIVVSLGIPMTYIRVYWKKRKRLESFSQKIN